MPAHCPGPRTLADCVDFLEARSELQAHWMGVIGERTRLPLVVLPWLPDGVFGSDALLELGERLLPAQVLAP
jgi:hypothetical protein